MIQPYPPLPTLVTQLPIPALTASQWLAVAAEAESAGLAPLLYVRLTERGADQVPAPARERLRQVYAATGLRYLLLQTAWGEVLAALQAAHIRVMVLKGAALLSQVYADPAIRPIRDLDLLITFDQFPQAQSLLRRLGFAPQYVRPFTDRSGLCWNEQAFMRPGAPEAQVELHWALLDIPRYAPHLNLTTLWERGRPITVAGVATRGLGLEDSLLHLSAHHLYHHQAQAELAILDITQVVFCHQDDINWSFVLQQAQTLHLSLALRVSLAAAAGLWAAPVPDWVLGQLARATVSLRERWWTAAQGSEFLKLLRTWLALPTLSLQLIYAWKQLFPDRAYLEWRYAGTAASSLWGLYGRRLAGAAAHLRQELRARIG